MFSTDVIPSPHAVILSEAKNLALTAQGKLREESRTQNTRNARFLVAKISSE